MEFELCRLQAHVGLGNPSHGLMGPWFSAPRFPASNTPGPNYSSLVVPPTPGYSESYSTASYTSQTDGHGSQVNSAPSISSGFSNGILQHSHTG